jgi:hypothetical protein
MNDEKTIAEPEVTPEMIEAGVNALWDAGCMEHPCGADRSVVQKVFTAMISASSFASTEK